MQKKFVVLAVLVLSLPLVTSGANSTNNQSSVLSDQAPCAGVLNPFRSNVTVNCTDIYLVASATGLPDHAYGPTPFAIRDQHFNLRFKLNPQQAKNTTATSLGPISLAVNGVAIFNGSTARSWNNNRNWEENAFKAEVNLDSCNGHPEPMMGTYHYHAFSSCVLKEVAGKNSQILGMSFDGFPIYGPWGYVNADGTGEVRLMKSSYRLKQGNRPSPPTGPGGAYDGTYVQDYEYVAGLGDLDECNGHFGVTPEYPKGIYHYHATVDANGTPVFPYILGCYRGIPDNLRPGR
ncbi:YHYH protein [Candidatus Acetothermia bacterium]|nr:YHYH protein [Candidatus Acetothermia bacterium]